MLSNKKVMDGIWGCCTPVKRLLLTVQRLPSAVAWRGSEWTASIWADSGGFWEGPFFAPLHPENWEFGKCSVVFHVRMVNWLMVVVFSDEPLGGCIAKDPLSVCSWQASMTAGGDEGRNGGGLQKAELVSSGLYEGKKSCLMRLFSSLLWQHEFERIKTIKELSRPKKLTQSCTRLNC